jgi:hypothetical protein
MCQKQCRDDIGFKCHMSESHQRQLLLFAENTDKYNDNFSKDIEGGYLELLKRHFGTKCVHANRVYQDYISERDHLDMNSTQWETLTTAPDYCVRARCAMLYNAFVCAVPISCEAVGEGRRTQYLKMDTRSYNVCSEPCCGIESTTYNSPHEESVNSGH